MNSLNFFNWAGGWAAIEYALVAGLMVAAAGYGRMIYDDLHENGAFSAVRYVVIGFFFLAVGFYFVSIVLKPGFPLYLLSLRRGRGACIVILCSAVYGYFSQSTDPFIKKIKQRKGMVALTALAAILLYCGGDFLWRAITHVGPGVWTFGGDVPGTGGNVTTDEFSEVIPEAEYKQECYVSAGILFMFGAVLLWGVIKEWRKRNALEKSWEQMISNPKTVEEIHQHPELYRDDFKQWIKENHPNLL